MSQNKALVVGNTTVSGDLCKRLHKYFLFDFRYINATKARRVTKSIRDPSCLRGILKIPYKYFCI